MPCSQGRQVSQWVEVRILLEHHWQDHLRTVCPQEGMAVRLRTRHGERREVATGAGPVLHHDRLPERCAQPLGQHPGADVGRATRRKADHQPDGPVGKILLLGCAEGGQEQQHARGRLLPVGFFLESPPLKQALGHALGPTFTVRAWKRCPGSACTLQKRHFTLPATPYAKARRCRPFLPG